MRTPVISLFTIFVCLVAVCSARKTEFDHDLRFIQENRAKAESHIFGASPTSHPATKCNHREKNNTFWLSKAMETIATRLTLKPNTNTAKNVILFIGDGMGISTHTAARIYNGQLKGKNGEETFLSFETFPYTGLSKTYCVDSQVADSACSSTAYTNGVKGNIGTLGLNGKVPFTDCEGSKNSSTHTESIISWAIKANKSTGVVTTTRITHASPAGTYSHTADRNWECDTDRPAGIDCQDIASQLVKNYPGNKINVLLGGGYKKFTLKTAGGQRADECLVKAYRENRIKNGEKFQVVKTKKDLSAINSTTDFVLGLFSGQHMEYELNKPIKGEEEPSLTEMTAKAIEILSKNKNGFYLFVEGGKIDLAHHANRAKLSLHETVEFANAIEKAYAMTDPSETLIVVTADHSHTFTIAGYPDRGNPILDISKFGGEPVPASDKLPYLTLGYNNGPGYKIDNKGNRRDLSQDQTQNTEFVSDAGIPMDYETHGGEDVAVFSSGPWAHLLVGNFEQNLIPVVMGYAAKIGPAASLPHVASSACVQGANLKVFLVLGMFVMLWRRKA